MSLTTLGGLKTALASWSTRSDLTAQLDDFALWAHQEICRRLRANVMLASADLTINAETISPPTGFLGFKRLYLDTSPRRVIQTASAEAVMDMATRYQADTYPSHVAVEGSLLRFGPTFSGSVTGKALYYKEPTALSADADTNAVLTKYPYVYLYGALEALYSYLEDDTNEAKYGGKFGALLEDINNRDAADTMRGPVQGAPYPGGIV